MRLLTLAFLILTLGCKKEITTPEYVLVCDGNSLTAGFPLDLSQSYPSVLSRDPLFVNVTVYNKGVSGQTTLDMIQNAPVNIDPLFKKGAVLIAWEVGNDIYYHGDAKQAVDNFWKYCDQRTTKGFYVIALTCTMRHQSTAFGDDEKLYNIKLNEANILMLSQYKAHAKAVIDIAADPRFADYNSIYYNQDGVHYTAKGYATLAEIIKNKLVKLIQ